LLRLSGPASLRGVADPNPAMKNDPSFELVASVMTTADAFLRESQRLFRPHGATGAQYNVLNILAAHPDGLSQRELGDLLVVDRSNVTGLLDRLEKLGLVRRQDHPDDRRVYRVSLTAAGSARWKTIHPLYLRAVADITRGLTVRQMREARKSLRHLESRAAAWRAKEPRSNKP
jgi:DNA-binding MarR family transcriptional regulator